MEYPKDYRKFIKADGWAEWSAEGHENDQGRGVPRPAPEKPYSADAKLIDLIAPEEFALGDMPLWEVIARRKSRRKYTDAPLTLEELSFLLWSTQGVRDVRNLADGTLTFRNVPSGGCLHAFETYLCINRVTGLAPGLYRYLPIEHKLLFIREIPDMPERVAEGCRDQSFAGTAAAVFVWTTIPYRMEWRYSIVANKIIAQDSGHLCQNLYLAAESIKAGTCAIGAYDQKKMDELIGVDGEEEFVIYVAPVGKVE